MEPPDKTVTSVWEKLGEKIENSYIYADTCLFLSMQRGETVGKGGGESDFKWAPVPGSKTATAGNSSFVSVRSHWHLQWTKIILSLSISYRLTCTIRVWVLIKAVIRQDGTASSGPMAGGFTGGQSGCQ